MKIFSITGDTGLQDYVMRYTGCPKINETHKIANKYVDFNPIVYIFQIW